MTRRRGAKLSFSPYKTYSLAEKRQSRHGDHVTLFLVGDFEENVSKGAAISSSLIFGLLDLCFIHFSGSGSKLNLFKCWNYLAVGLKD